MANILGQMIVNLLANTVSFEQGMNAASKKAQATAKEIQGSFNDLGDVVGKLLEPLGEIGAGFEKALSGVGSTASSIVKSLGPLGGAFGEVAAGAVALSAVGAAAGVAVLGIAAHAAESAAHLEDLSHATGLSVESLSGLGQVAETKGIDIDSMSKALERMSKSALTAAQQGPRASNAYTQLGVAVQNADGTMRSAQAIFDDISRKFAAMPDGPQKTALAMQLFGRAGANMIALLDEGGAHLADLQEQFTRLNSVVSGPTAKASEEFKEKMTLLGAAFTGIQNDLLSDLIPALNVAAQEFVSFFEENQDGIKSMADGLANVAKVVLNVFQVIAEVLSLLYRTVFTAVDEIQVAGSTLANVGKDIAKGNVGDAWKDVKDGAKTAASEAKTNFEQAVDGITGSIKSIKNVWTATLPTEKPAQGATTPPVRTIDTSFIDKAVAKLQAQAKAEEELANAIGKASSTTIEANAAAEAQKEIDTLVAEAVDKLRISHEQAVAIVNKHAAAIREATEWEQTFKQVVEDNKSFDAFTQKIAEQTAAMSGEAEAQGKVAQAAQKEQATLVPLRNEVEEMQKQYTLLSERYGEQNPQVQDLAAKLAILQQRYNDAASAVAKYNAAAQQKAFNDEATKLDLQLNALKETDDALVSGGETYAQIDEQVKKYTLDLSLNVEQQEALRQKLTQIQALEQDQAAAKLVAANDPTLSQQAQNLQQQITYLTQLRDQWQQMGKDITPVTEALQQVQGEYDKILLKTNNVADGAKAAWDELTKQTTSDAQLTYDLLTKGLQGFEDNLANTISTGKAKWSDYFNSLEDMILKSSINKLFQTGLQNISGTGFGQTISSLFGTGTQGQGAGAASLTTAGTTLESAGAQLIEAATSLTTFSSGGAGDSGSFLNDLLGGGSGGGDTSGDGSGGGLSDLFDFGGFMADGGETTPGKAYIVGEKHPELFMPGQRGSIVPQIAVAPAGGGGDTHITMNVSTPDANSFGKSQSQLMGQAYRQASFHGSRNSGR